ncbi:MAG: DUF6788 family protein [Acidimicrobiales bacterium]
MESPTHDPDTPMTAPATGDDARAAQARIAARLAQIGFALPGTITERMRRCGKPNCRCARDPAALHGPYIQWTRTVTGKTVTKQLNADQWARYQPWFDNARELRELLTRLEAISLDVITHTEGWGAKT